MTAKICYHVLGSQRQNLIGLLAKLACVLLLRSKKGVWKGNIYVIYSIFKNQIYDVMNVVWKAVFQIEI